MRLFLLAAALSLIAPAKESFEYSIEWRMIDAGSAKLTVDNRTAHLDLRSQGLVSRLFKVIDIYDVAFDDKSCVQHTRLQSEEGSRKRDTVVRWAGGKSHYIERDLKKNGEVILERELAVPACVYDVVLSLRRLRSLDLPLGQAIVLPVSDGKKLAQARVEAQAKEKISTKLGTFNATRYEAFLFNDVLFKRNARLFVWIGDDARRLPLQIQIRMRIHIGTVTLQLDKADSIQ